MKKTILFMIMLCMSYASYGQSTLIPSSYRSHQSIKQIKPILVKQLAKRKLKYGAPIYIRVFKQENKLELWMKKGKKFKLFKTYPICRYSGKLGPKLKEGDEQSPEGFYFVTPKQLNPFSQFHLSFNIGYPNQYDRAHKRTGKHLMIHGDCVSVGCYAMTDRYISEIYALADGAFRQGQRFFRVHAFPFRMTNSNMKKYANPTWQDFWSNLKEGYDLFNSKKIPPNVLVKNKHYVFE